jgi:hypothetical protein
VNTFTGSATFDTRAAPLTVTSAGNRDVFITKLDVIGTHVWTRTIGGTGDEYAAHVVLGAPTFGPDRAVIVTGTFQTAFDSDPSPAIELQPRITGAAGADLFVSAFSSTGGYEWTRTTPGWAPSDRGPSVMLSDDSFLFGGQFAGSSDFDSTSGVDSHSSVGQTDVYVTKLVP